MNLFIAFNDGCFITDGFVRAVAIEDCMAHSPYQAITISNCVETALYIIDDGSRAVEGASPYRTVIVSNLD